MRLAIVMSLLLPKVSVDLSFKPLKLHLYYSYLKMKYRIRDYGAVSIEQHRWASVLEEHWDTGLCVHERAYYKSTMDQDFLCNFEIIFRKQMGRRASVSFKMHILKAQGSQGLLCKFEIIFRKHMGTRASVQKYALLYLYTSICVVNKRTKIMQIFSVSFVICSLGTRVSEEKLVTFTLVVDK